MNSLILDCSCGMNVLVVSNGQTFLYRDDNNKKHTDDLLVNVDEKLNEAGISVHDLDAIGVCAGPGSFTGIRVAISMVKGLAVNSKAKIFELSNFDAFDGNGCQNYACVLDGFSSFVYAKFVQGERVSSECIDVKELAEKLKNENVGDVFVLTEKTQNTLLKNEIQSQIVENNIVKAFLKKVEQDDTVELNQIAPVYLRASQAEIERNKKLNLG